MLAIDRPVVFPLFAIDGDRCACGADGCKRIGKHAAVNWGDVVYGSAVPRPAPGAGVGLRTGAAPKGSGVFVVDLDSEDAGERFAAMGPCPKTVTVKTPRGRHVYFRHPGFHVKNSAGDLGKGIDIRGDGGFVVAPGSPHRSGGVYVSLGGELADAPAWLLEWLKKQKAPTEAQHYPGDVSGTERDYRRDLYAAYLKNDAPARGPALRGQGDQTLFNVVQRGAYDLALPVDDVLELVAEHYDPRCDPQWGDELEERVMHKAHDAKTNSARPRAEPLPFDLAHLATSTPPAPPESGVQLVATPSPELHDLASIEKRLKLTWGKWDEPLPPAVYVVAPIVPAATLGAIVAKGSSLKTWLVVSLLSSVASGLPWLGHFAVQKSPTLLVDFESGRDIVHERVQFLRAAGAENLGIASFPDGRIDDPAFWKDLGAVVQHHGIKLVAIDSLAAGAAGVDENDTRAALPLHQAARFIEKTGCTVVLIHHAKKGEGGDERDLVRGSGAIFGAADWIYTMIPQDEDRTKMLVRNIKAFRKKTDDFRIALTIDGLVLDDEITDGSKKASELRAQITRLLSRGPVPTRHGIDAGIGKQNGATRDALDAMVVERMVVKLPKTGYQLDHPAARLERIRQACQVPKLAAPATLAKAAHVDVDEVLQLLATGKLTASGSGYLILP